MPLPCSLKLLRTDLTDRHRDDRQAFDAFADHLREQLKEVAQMLSQAATEQIVDALRQVIADFNQKITEQFGDNFKRLDASVQKLVEWQEHYRQQLEQLHALYDQSVQNITKIDSAVEHIAESSSSIPDSMEKLAGIVETASHQLAELERHLAAFAQLRDRAVEAVPQMQAHVEEITRYSRSREASSGCFGRWGFRKKVPRCLLSNLGGHAQQREV
jgi:methyl-accepting chemotaxis protein